MYKKTVLKNGLRVITHNIKDRDSIAIGFWIGVGGRYEDDCIKGVAHFLEHIVFKGSQKYSCEKIKSLIEGIGGALNAFTSEEQTCFYAKIPSQHLNQTFDVLADMVSHPKIATKDVHKEKTVIVEEIKMYQDLPQYFVLELLEALLWPGHPLGKNLAGTPESVMGISDKDLKRFHQRFYAPGNIVVAACGNLTHDRIVALVKKKLGGLHPSSKIGYRKIEGAQSEPRTRFYKKNIEQMHLALGFSAYDENHKDRYVLSLLSTILGGNMSSRLFVEVREKRGLAYSISCSYKALHDTGIFLIRAGVDNQKVVEAVTLILKELNKIRREGVGQNEFQRAREYLSGQLLLGLEDTMEHMLWVGEGMITKNKIKTRKGILKEFKKIKPVDIKRIANEILNAKHYNLAIVGPINDRQEKQLCKLVKV
jgi:predicted Zn-dependent peptidase